jgi:hypothetical protein
VASSTRKPLLITASAVIGIGALALVLWPDRPVPVTAPPARTDLPHLTGAPNHELEAPPEPVDVDAQVREIMGRWRNAILKRDPDSVLECDRIFHDHTMEFGPALRTSAESDDDERVRAFSTRMLGKLRDGDSAPVFAKLLNDPSPSVRGNAVWGLEQLGDPRAHKLSPSLAGAGKEEARRRTPTGPARRKLSGSNESK